MYYIGLDVHKKTISYCVKEVSGQIHSEGTVPATRPDLDTLDENSAAAVKCGKTKTWTLASARSFPSGLVQAHYDRKHYYRKFKVSVNGRIGRTARLFRTSAKVRYVKSRLTGNAAAGNAYNVADMASLLQAVRNAGANNVVILGAWRTRATSRRGCP